ncbi:hypothetical protein BC629DRAFT_1486236 [Irpex lacteus]|nr:hypothetical protein BC629DRAFT_1577711 [Irpex lacteus]KAI0806210.1 hypothetical protein BC629DRAFT_1486236 [Irpex lacteus]
MHNAHRCGDWWRNIANYEFRADCPNCKTEESIEHILCECDIPGQNQIWSLRSHTGTSRLFRILVSESAHLIWKLRCERVMDRGDDPSNWHSREEIKRRWAKAIDSRLALDQTLTDKVFGAEEWVNYKGGLVGIRTPELRPNRNRPYQGGVT